MALPAVMALLFSIGTAAQSGTTGYEYLNIPVSAHSAALGSYNISIGEDDATLMFNNPALLSNVSSNTVNFNFMTFIAGSKKLSKHAQGLAIDINPLYNPCVRRKKDGTLKVEPATGKPYVDRSKSFKYKITTNDLCYRLFLQHGFRWGGSWRTLKDYQHFEK